MFKEQDFHKLIRRQNKVERDNLWNKIESQSEEEEIELGEVLRKKHTNYKNFFIICVSAVLLIISIGLILKYTLPDKKTPIDDGIRYCVSGDYYSVETETSIAEYSNEHNLELLYFDWYAEAEYIADIQFKLKTTDEVVCLKENLLDLNGYFIEYYITDDRTELDFLAAFNGLGENTEEIKGVSVNLGASKLEAYACFTFNKNHYYLIISAETNQEYILELIETLLP